MSQISVALRNNGTIDVDLDCSDREKEEDEVKWTFNNMSLEEATFLRDELSDAITRAKAKGLPVVVAPKVVEPTAAEKLEATGV